MGKAKFYEPLPPEMRDEILYPMNAAQRRLSTPPPKARILLGIAGIQGGKTSTGCRMTVETLMKLKHGFIMVIAPSYKLLTQATIPKLKQVLDARCPNWLTYEDNHVRMEWHDQNHNTIYLRSSNKPDKQLRGPTLDFVFFDEAAMEPRPQPFRILKQRLHIKKGLLLITTTPKGNTWLRTEVYEPWEMDDENYHVVKWRSIDNPKFDMEEYEEAKQYQDPRWVAQEYDAEFTDFGGLVFPIYEESKHLDDWEWRPELPVYLGIDFGIANPTYIGFWQAERRTDRLESGEKKVWTHYHQFDELERSNLPFPQIWEMVKAKPYFDFPRGRKPRYVCCDPTGRYREKVAGHGCDMIILRDKVPIFTNTDWNTDQVRQAGILTMYALLTKEQISWHRTRCHSMKRAFRLYSRPAGEEMMRQKEMPVKDGVSDHPMEATFYFLNKRPVLTYETMDELRKQTEYEYVESLEGTGF